MECIVPSTIPLSFTHREGEGQPSNDLWLKRLCLFYHFKHCYQWILLHVLVHVPWCIEHLICKQGVSSLSAVYSPETMCAINMCACGTDFVFLS